MEQRLWSWRFWKQHIYVQYSIFSIGDNITEYTLSIEGYSGTTGDGLICDGDGSDWNHRNGMKFSAKDNNNNADH